jgi:FkbM family methyltransferase
MSLEWLVDAPHCTQPQMAPNVGEADGGRIMRTGTLPAEDTLAPAGGFMATLKARFRVALKWLLPAPLFWRFDAWRVGHFDVELYLLPYLCDRAKASIDVGASTGSYTVHLLKHSAQCYAFEPRRDAAAYLTSRLTARPNARLRVETVALSDHAGEARLRVATTDTGRSTIEAANPLQRAGPIEHVTVATRRLDDYAAIMGPVACIKIDVEGHEDAVLRGADGILARDRPSLLVEIEERHKPGSIRTITRYLGERGYRGFFFRSKRLHAIESFNVDTQQDVSKVGEKIDGESVYVNTFLFFAADRLARVRHLIEDR